MGLFLFFPKNIRFSTGFIYFRSFNPSYYFFSFFIYNFICDFFNRILKAGFFTV
ncbi:hypothetical protein ESA_02305 [Cronobacter sakazakii ATCC BAA-894]|uniref:Uncharacterized protein n=1 Tax=Cronobacter sakazakii (strain ATCC BAA-894) TaxID=290339 RepID=A7MG26_CROS8|nr:hypothetical protein ESA_02305 [Cronobacter sakazakii ATCC BAA-894]